PVDGHLDPWNPASVAHIWPIFSQDLAPSSGAWPTPRLGSINSPPTSDHKQGSDDIFDPHGNPSNQTHPENSSSKADLNPDLGDGNHPSRTVQLQIAQLANIMPKSIDHSTIHIASPLMTQRDLHDSSSQPSSRGRDGLAIQTTDSKQLSRINAG
ncbi:hypothetical protein ACLOJK_014972, partial [Asimina triloba]